MRRTRREPQIAPHKSAADPRPLQPSDFAIYKRKLHFRAHECAPMSRSSDISAGLLAYRRRDGLEVLLAHPGGPFWAKKDAGVWTIPKGLAEPGADLLATAQREFTEETNLSAAGAFIALAPVKQKSGKIVHAWAFEADLDLAAFASNTFEIEWPPKSGRRKAFPEIDRIAYFALPAARSKILRYQLPLLRELEQRFT
jgi:predicted NUDIX family NTP pyrophosphohydrolase